MMKRTAPALVVLMILFVSVSVVAGTSEDSKLLQACRQYEHAISQLDATPQQRATLVLALAASEVQTADPAELLSVYTTLSRSAVELLTSDTSSSWNEGTWLGESRTTYSYDGSSRLSGAINEYFNGSSWQNMVQALYTYDASNRMLTMTIKQWQASAWVNYSLTTYSVFTVDGFPGLALTQAWTGSAWKDTTRITMTYANGRQTSSTFQSWSGSSWVNSSKTTYTYDVSGNMTEWLIQSWTGAWTNVSRVTSTYNASGDELQSISQIWNAGVWENLSKHDYTYDGSHNLILDVRSSWLGVMWMAMSEDTLKYSGGNLVEVVTLDLFSYMLSRVQYSYTAGGNVTLELEQDWDMVEEVWVNYARTVSVYGGMSCCVGTTGNVNMLGIIDLTDLSWLIDYLTRVPRITLPCPEEANVNGLGIIDLTDLSWLIDYMTIVPRRTLPACP